MRLVNVGDGVWVDPDAVDALAEERGPNASSATGIIVGGERLSVVTPVDEVAKRINEAE